DLSHLSFGLPPIHRAPNGAVYPQLFRDLANAGGDAVLRAACAFIADGTGTAPRHYRALGRSALLAAALSADRKLDRIARSFDFLLSVSPINTAEAMAEFVAAGGERPPRFEYRPLTVDPDDAKRRLYAVDLGKLEDPLLETLLSDKRREIDHQLTMLSARNTPAFRPASMLLYGTVDWRQPEREMGKVRVAVDQLGHRRLEIRPVAALDLATAQIDLDRRHRLGQRIAGAIGAIVITGANNGAEARQERGIFRCSRRQFLVEQGDDQDVPEMLAHVGDHHP
ncbi:MAG TPA: tyrosine/phenylalanine carboxypeptidase domain-containing protein, partial [Sphingomicrobium sp.]